MKRKKIKNDEKIPVYFTEDELKIIRNKTFCDPEFGKLGLVEKGRIRVDMTLYDIEDVQGYVAAEANHTNNKKLEKKLDRIFIFFQKFLDEYEVI